MAKKQLILDFAEYDLNQVVADIEEIRRYNPQRYEMEHLTAVCFEDCARNVCVGYKDLRPDEFWVRGHMPGLPLMPGVIMCEAAAQLASYYSHKYNLMTGVIGFGGLEEVRFRGLVRPGDRFVIVSRLLKLRRCDHDLRVSVLRQPEPGLRRHPEGRLAAWGTAGRATVSKRVGR